MIVIRDRLFAAVKKLETSPSGASPIAVSTDGVSWRKLSTPSYWASVKCLAEFGSELYVAVRPGRTGKFDLFASSDLVSWCPVDLSGVVLPEDLLVDDMAVLGDVLVLGLWNFQLGARFLIHRPDQGWFVIDAETLRESRRRFVKEHPAAIMANFDPPLPKPEL
ncbi:hypothetical protein JW905_11375 [bacterium]|nr:hypothetical protein [candidate division CSSED10-310 bacterium]